LEWTQDRRKNHHIARTQLQWHWEDRMPKPLSEHPQMKNNTQVGGLQGVQSQEEEKLWLKKLRTRSQSEVVSIGVLMPSSIFQ